MELRQLRYIALMPASGAESTASHLVLDMCEEPPDVAVAEPVS